MNRLNRIEQLAPHFHGVDFLYQSFQRETPYWVASLVVDPDVNDWEEAALGRKNPMEFSAPTLRGAIDALLNAVAVLPYTTWDAEGTEHHHNHVPEEVK